MPRGVLKENLPVKTCVICLRPFNWRKKWEKCWDEVSTCSKSCNFKRKEDKSGRAVRVGEGDEGEGDDDDDGKTTLVTGLAAATVSASSLTPAAEVPSPSEEDRSLLSELAAAAASDDNDDDDAAAEKEAARGTESEEFSVGSREWRKAQRKAAKLQQRKLRQGGTACEDIGRKSCDLCTKRVDLLIRCTVDASGKWRMVCGTCWKDVSGGVPDGDAAHPHYTYGGLWKNRGRSAT